MRMAWLFLFFMLIDSKLILFFIDWIISSNQMCFKRYKVEQNASFSNVQL